MNDADVLLPFQIDAGAYRGRLIRLAPALDAILAGHDYPEPVAELLAETALQAALLAGAIKYDGVFTLQTQSDGAVPMLVADVTSRGDLRGHARFDPARLEAADPGLAPVPRLLGRGYLAFTVDQGPQTDRYQGIVELGAGSLADAVLNYFERSEQLATAVEIAVHHDAAGWRGAALMIQRMPLAAAAPLSSEDDAEEDWRRATALLASVTAAELLDPALAGDRLLYRLFHAEGLRLHQPRSLRARCRCSAIRVERTLRSFPREELEQMKDEGGDVVVTCEFCKARYVYGDADLDRFYAT